METKDWHKLHLALRHINYEELLNIEDYSEETQAEDGDWYNEWCAGKIVKALKDIMKNKGDLKT